MEAQAEEIQAGEAPQPLAPHRYPAWVLLFFAAILAVAVYSLTLLPKYLEAAGDLKAAALAYRTGDFKKSIASYNRALELEPTSKSAIIGEAEALFANGDSSDDEQGLNLLQDIKLDSSEWTRIAAVLPPGFEQYFGDAKE
jgi:tetratricopeptide (TPR) repeat protein